MNALTLVAVQIGEQAFAIDVMSVREIRGWSKPTPLPHAPHYVHGMTDLRGVVIPIIDLGARLGLEPVEAVPSSVVVVAEIHGRLVGLLVDAVCDLISVEAEAVQPTPETGGGESREIIAGIIEADGRILSLMRLEALIPTRLAEAGAPPAPGSVEPELARRAV